MHRRKNYHFFVSQVKKPQNTYFEFTPGSARWSDSCFIEPFTDRDGLKFDEIIVDLNLKGNICEYNSRGKTFFSEPIDLQLTIRAYISEDGWIGLDNINLLNTEQKALLAFHQQYETELERLGVKTIF